MNKQQEALKLALEALEYISSHYMSLPKIGCMALAAVDEALAEQPAQQQEPFAYVFTGIKQNGEHHGPHLVWKPEYMDAMSASMGAVAVPLYTSPPASKPWVGLTDEDLAGCDDEELKQARYWEAKLKEKNT